MGESLGEKYTPQLSGTMFWPRNAFCVASRGPGTRLGIKFRRNFRQRQPYFATLLIAIQRVVHLYNSLLRYDWNRAR